MGIPEVGVRAVVQNLQGFSSDSKKVTQGFTEMDSAASGLGKTSSGITGSLTSVASGILKIGAAATGGVIVGITGLTAAIAGFAVTGVKAAVDVDDQMAQIAATLGKTKDEISPLKDLLFELSLAPDLKVNATEAGQAIEMLARNGLELEEIMDGAARGTVELANATKADFATAADVATDAMAQFGFKANELSQVADGITGVLTNSKFSIDDYALALANAGGVAGSLGVDFNDFNTVLAATASQFSSGSDAGTSFKNLLARLSKPTDQVKAAMEQYGLSLFDANGNMKSFAEIAGELNRVFNGTVTLTSQVGGATKEQAKAAETASKNIGKLTADIEAQEKRLELLQDDYGAIVFHYGETSHRARDAALDIEELTRKINDNKNKMVEYEAAIAAVDGAQTRQITTTKELTEAEKAELATILGGTDSMRTILGLAELTTDEFAALSGEVNRTGAASESAATRVDSLKGAWEIFRGVIDGIQIQVGDQFLPLLRQVTGSVTDLATQAGPLVVDFFGQVAEVMEDVIAKASELFTAFQKGGFTGLAEALGIPPEIISNITSAITEVQRLADIFNQAFESGGLSGGLSAVLLDLKTQFIEFISGLVADLIPRIPEFLGQLVTGIETYLRDNWPTIQGGLNEWRDRFWEWVNEAIGNAGSVLEGIVIAILAWANDSKTQESLSNIGKSLGASLVSGAGQAGEDSTATARVLAKIVIGLGAAVAGLAGALIIIGGELVAGIISGILESIGIDLQPATFNELRGILVQIGSDIATIAREVGKKIMIALNDGMANINKTFEGIIKNVKTIWNETDWLQLGVDLMEGIWEGLKEKAPEVLEWLKSLIPDWVQNLTNIAGAHSPATITMPLGASLIQGLVAGAQGEDFAAQFVDSLNMGTIARELGGGGSGWKELRRIISAGIQSNMHLLASGSTEGVMGVIQQTAQRFQFPPEFAASFAEMHGLIEQVSSQYAAAMQRMRVESLATATQLAGQFAGISGSFATMLQEQMGSMAEAIKIYQDFQKENDKLSKEYDKQQEKLADLQAELAEATIEYGDGSERVIELREEIAKLTHEMEVNQAAQTELTEATRRQWARVFTLGAGGAGTQGMGTMAEQIAALQDFLASGAEAITHNVAGQNFVLFDRISAQERLNELLAEQARQEQEILRQQEAQRKLDFLGQQVQLLKMIQDRGLNPADILGGIQLGVNASVEDLLAATNNVVEAMINQINDTLQIHSPSAVMAGIGEQIMAGLQQGVVSMVPALNTTLQASVAGPVLATAGAAAGPSYTYNQTFQLGGNTFTGAAGEDAVFEQKVLDVIRRNL